MRLYMLLCLLGVCFLPEHGYSQKFIELPPNQSDTLNFNFVESRLKSLAVEDLTKSQDSVKVRIWDRQHVITITKKQISLLTFIKSSSNNNTEIIKEKLFNSDTASKLMSLHLSDHIFDLPGSRFEGIDGFRYLFEVSTPQKYRLYGYWSPVADRGTDMKDAANILYKMGKVLEMSKNDICFFNQLETGLYLWGSTPVSIDCLMGNSSKKIRFIDT